MVDTSSVSIAISQTAKLHYLAYFQVLSSSQDIRRHTGAFQAALDTVFIAPGIHFDACVCLRRSKQVADQKAACKQQLISSSRVQR